MSDTPDAFASIDTSPLDALLRLRSDIDALDARLAAMQARRDSVAEAVYARVRDDYEQRRRGLDADAAPLRTQARGAYAALHALLQRIDADHDAARLDREELDFRFSLDEFDAAEHQRRVVDIDQRLIEHGDAGKRGAALRERFVQAFGSRDALEQDEASVRNDPVHAESATVPMRALDPRALQSPSGPATVTLPTLRPDAATQVMRTLNPDGTPPRSDQTLVMRTARLLPQSPEAGAQPVVIALKPLLLGSGSDCDVKIAAARAHHAEIRASMAGFTVTDHGGGVSINGVAVEQHLLRQDDVLDVAGARFLFRES